MSISTTSGDKPCRQLDRLNAVGGLADDLEIRFAVQNRPKAVADQGLVVGQQHPDRAGRSRRLLDDRPAAAADDADDEVVPVHAGDQTPVVETYPLAHADSPKPERSPASERVGRSARPWSGANHDRHRLGRSGDVHRVGAPRACLSAFVRASWTIRYAVSVQSGRQVGPVESDPVDDRLSCGSDTVQQRPAAGPVRTGLQRTTDSASSGRGAGRASDACRPVPRVPSTRPRRAGDRRRDRASTVSSANVLRAATVCSTTIDSPWLTMSCSSPAIRDSFAARRLPRRRHHASTRPGATRRRAESTCRPRSVATRAAAQMMVQKAIVSTMSLTPSVVGAVQQGHEHDGDADRPADDRVAPGRLSTGYRESGQRAEEHRRGRLRHQVHRDSHRPKQTTTANSPNRRRPSRAASEGHHQQADLGTDGRSDDSRRSTHPARSQHGHIGPPPADELHSRKVARPTGPSRSIWRWTWATDQSISRWSRTPRRLPTRELTSTGRHDHPERESP